MRKYWYCITYLTWKSQYRWKPANGLRKSFFSTAAHMVVMNEGGIVLPDYMTVMFAKE